VCFSPEADIGGGLLICAIGVDAVRHIGQRREFIALAWIPVLLGAHQFIEALSGYGSRPCAARDRPRRAVGLPADRLRRAARLHPLAVIALEPTRRRKQLMAPFALLGTAIAVTLFAAMVRGRSR